MSDPGHNPLVSVLSRAGENLPEEDIPAAEFIDSVRKGQFKRQIQEIRDKFARALERTGGDRQTAKKSVDWLKKRLPVATFSGVFKIRADDQLSAHSGLIQADLDLLDTRLAEVRTHLQADPHVWALFVSPTGDGLKAIYRVPVCADKRQHEVVFHAVSAHVKKLCGVDIDNTPDLSRACFVSFDPDAYLNQTAPPLPVDFTLAVAMVEAKQPDPVVTATSHVDLSERQRIAEALLGSIRWEDATTGFCHCPGSAGHTTGAGDKDCKIWIGNVPTLHCVHTSCAGIVAGVNHELRSRVGKAECQPSAPVTRKKGKPAKAAGYETEFEIANRLAAELPPLRTVGNKWHVYRQGAWGEIDRALFRPGAQNILPPDIRTARGEATLLDHLEGRFQTSADTFAGFHRLTPGGDILLNVANGVVRLGKKGAKLEAHDPAHLFTLRIAASYDATASAPLFQRVLGEALPDEHDRVLFQLCAGNFLLPDCRFETALVGYGEAGRGKSTLAEPLGEALGRALVPRLTMGQICDPKSYHVPKLKFAAVNLGTELDAVELGDSATFKAIVSGEPIEARPIYGAPFTMQTTCKLWFLANSLPRFKHGTEAELRRTRFLRFDYLPPVKDVALKGKLALERNGVFRWMVEGLVELLTLPNIPLGGRESRQVHERFKVSNDPIGSFVGTRCRLDAAAKVAKESLRGAFQDYSERHNLPASMGDWFFRNLYERWPQLKEVRESDGERRRFIAGIELSL